MTKDTSYYRIDHVPTWLWKQFERAAQQVSDESEARGAGAIAQGACIVAFLQAVNLADATAAGQVVAARAKPDTPKENVGVHVPSTLKQRITTTAKARGLKVGAIGRLVLQAHAQELKELIERGLGIGTKKTAAG